MSSEDSTINDILKNMQAELNQKLTRQRKGIIKKTLSKGERVGLKWCECIIEEGKLSVVEAEEGGAIHIVSPELLHKDNLEKLENLNIYNKFEEDLTQRLHREIFVKWVERKGKGPYTSILKQLKH